MIANISAEALGRLATSRSLLRVADVHERSVGLGTGDAASRATKGMLFVNNYATYEYVVVEAVRTMVVDLNRRGLPINGLRSELMSMALDSEFSSIIGGSLKKTWSARTTLLRKLRSTDVVMIHENLFPKDGSNFRPPQLETIWSLFGMPLPIVTPAALFSHIVEMVDTRNSIAHGNEAPDRVGGRFSVRDMERRIDDTESVCTQILATIGHHITGPTAYAVPTIPPVTP